MAVIAENELAEKVAELESRARFIECVQTRELDLTSGKSSLQQILDRMDALQFHQRRVNRQGAEVPAGEDRHPNERSIGRQDGRRTRYAYMLDMPLSMLTSERVEAARKEREAALLRLEELRQQDSSAAWAADLLDLRGALVEERDLDLKVTES